MHRGVKTSVCLTCFTVIGAQKAGTGPLIIRFQGVTSTQDYKNILVYSSEEHGGMDVTDLRLNENEPKELKSVTSGIFLW